MRCHADPSLKRQDGRSVWVNADEIDHSKHGALACTACHTGTGVGHSRPCETVVKKVVCASCHATVSAVYLRSTHGKLITSGDPNAPNCTDCHGTHGVRGSKDTASATFPVNIPRLCAQCHREGQKAAVRYTGDQHQIIEHYTESIHGKGLVKSGLVVTATCISCHTAHSVLPKTDSLSTVAPANIPNTCGKCHVGIQEKFAESIHAQAEKNGEKAPVCSDCHTAHMIRRTDEAGFRLEIMSQCGNCHQRIASTYFDTYHGKVAQLGYAKTAKCYDCHGSHDIQKPSDPRSLLHPKNILNTCRKCHPSASAKFTSYVTHANYISDREHYPVLFWAFWAMTGLIGFEFLVDGIHTVLWYIRDKKVTRDARNGRKNGGKR